MNKAILKHDLENNINDFKKRIEPIQARGYTEDYQCAINELSEITLQALTDFKDSILKSIN